MRKLFLVLSIITFIIGAVALAGALLSNVIPAGKMPRETLDYSDEMILQQPYFDIVAAGGENLNLFSDIESYSLGDGYIHLYLPTGVNEDSVVVYIRDEEGNNLARRVYNFTERVMIGAWEVLVEHHNLPTLYFVSDDHDLFETMNAFSQMDIVCDGKMCVDYRDKRAWNDYGITHASLKIRGNSSREWTENKRSYSLKLDRAINLLGLGKNKSWNLIGNAFDKSLLKNTVFNSISEEIGIKYQPQMQNVNLYVDGKYQGVYTLTTKIKAGKNRIPLEKGDYLFKMDPPTQDQPVLYESGDWHDDDVQAPVADLVYPDNASEEDIEEAQRILQRFIEAIKNPASEKITGVCDIDSLVRYYWIQEASMNFDSWERSVYLYYLKDDDKIHLGPEWDMDLSLGYKFDKHGLQFDKPEGWITREHGWYEKLLENEDFKRMTEDAYYNGGIRESLYYGLDTFENEKKKLGQDAYYNYMIYGYSNNGYTLDYGDSYDEYCNNMIEFYRKRLNWIDSAMNDSCERYKE